MGSNPSWIKLPGVKIGCIVCLSALSLNKERYIFHPVISKYLSFVCIVFCEIHNEQNMVHITRLKVFRCECTLCYTIAL